MHSCLELRNIWNFWKVLECKTVFYTTNISCEIGWLNSMRIWSCSYETELKWHSYLVIITLILYQLLFILNFCYNFIFSLIYFRYDISGKVMPHLRPWFEANLGVDPGYETKSQTIEEFEIPPPVENNEIHEMLKERGISFSNAPRIRLMRAHGHTVYKPFLDIKQ